MADDAPEDAQPPRRPSFRTTTPRGMPVVRPPSDSDAIPVIDETAPELSLRLHQVEGKLRTGRKLLAVALTGMLGSIGAVANGMLDGREAKGRAAERMQMLERQVERAERELERLRDLVYGVPRSRVAPDLPQPPSKGPDL